MNARRISNAKFRTGYQFNRRGTDLYDGEKHIGRLVMGTHQIALYNERKAYLSSVYRTRLTDYVRKEMGWAKTDIIWF